MAHIPQTLEQQKQQLRLVWMAMFGAICAYAVTCVLIVGRADISAEAPERFRIGFSVAGIVLGASSIWWWRHFLSTDSVPGGRDTDMQFSRFQTHSVVVWVLSDAVAACGLVLACLVRSFQEFLPFGVAGAVLLVRHHPFRLPYERLRPLAS